MRNRLMCLVKLRYLALHSVEMSKQRVAERVKHGGHDIPLKDIERRFSRSLNNLFNDFSHIVDSCLCYMNDGGKPVLIFEQKKDRRNIIRKGYYETMLKGVDNDNKL